MASKVEFESIIDSYISLTDLFEGIYLRYDILHNSGVNLSKEVRDFIIKFNDIYYNNIWKYPALIISKNTMRGIRKDECIARCQEQLKFADEKLQATIERVGEDADNLGLIPSSSDLENVDRELYTRNRDDQPHQLLELWNIYNRI
jgi:hypothetical protein